MIYLYNFIDVDLTLVIFEVIMNRQLIFSYIIEKHFLSFALFV